MYISVWTKLKSILIDIYDNHYNVSTMLHILLCVIFLFTKIKFLPERARFESHWRDELENDASIDSVDTNSVGLAYEYNYVEHWERNIIIIRYIMILFYTTLFWLYFLFYILWINRCSIDITNKDKFFRK